MRILLVQNRFYPAIGGAETHVYLLSKYLARKGHDVTVYTTNSLSNKDVASFSFVPPFIRREEDKRDMPSEEYINGVRVKRFDFKFRYWSFNWAPDMFKELKENIKYFDIIHAHGYHTSTSVVSCYHAKRWNRPFILTGHLLTIPDSISPTAKFFKKTYDLSLGSWLIRNSSKLIATTEDNAQEYEKIGAKKDRIVTIPNGIELGSYFNINKKTEKKLKEDDDILLFVGRLEWHKGVRDVLEIMPKILERTPAKFIIVCEDYGSKSELVELAKKLKINENIVFTGKISRRDLIAIYRQSSIFVFPSKNENFGVVLLEAMVTRTLCIAYSIPSVRSVIKNGENGILVKDKEELLDKILYYLTNADERREIENNALKYVRKYDVKNIVDAIENVYTEVLD